MRFFLLLFNIGEGCVLFLMMTMMLIDAMIYD